MNLIARLGDQVQIHEKKLIAFGTAVGVLVLSGLLGAMLINPQAQVRLLLVPLGAAGLGFGLWLVRRQELGPLLLVAAAFLAPFGLGTGTQTTINSAILVAAFLGGLWAADRLIIQRRFSFYWSAAVRAMAGLCLAVTASFLIGQLDWFLFAEHAPLRSQLGGLGLFYLSGLAFLLPGQVFGELKWLKRMTWLFVGLGGLQALASIVPGMGWIGGFFNDGAGGSVFWIWMIAIPLSQGVVNQELNKRQRWLLIGLAAVIWIGRFMQYRSWVSGWLPPAVGGLVILVLTVPWAGITGAGAALFLGLQRINFFLSNLDITDGGGENYSYITRLDAVQALWPIIRANPISGLGPANYYFYTPLSPLRGYYLQFNSHNQYMDLLAQAGIIGLGAFLWLAFRIGRLGWRLFRKLPRGFGRAYAAGAIGGLAGMLVSGLLGDWVIPFVYNIGLNGFQASVFGWLFLGGLVCLERLGDEDAGGQG